MSHDNDTQGHWVQPHPRRAPLLLALAIVGLCCLVTGTAGVPLGLLVTALAGPAPVVGPLAEPAYMVAHALLGLAGLVLSLALCLITSKDQKRICNGLMPLAGERLTRWAGVVAMIGAILGLGHFLFCVLPLL